MSLSLFRSVLCCSPPYVFFCKKISFTGFFSVLLVLTFFLCRTGIFHSVQQSFLLPSIA